MFGRSQITLKGLYTLIGRIAIGGGGATPSRKIRQIRLAVAILYAERKVIIRHPIEASDALEYIYTRLIHPAQRILIRHRIRPWIKTQIQTWVLYIVGTQGEGGLFIAKPNTVGERSAYHIIAQGMIRDRQTSFEAEVIVTAQGRLGNLSTTALRTVITPVDAIIMMETPILFNRRRFTQIEISHQLQMIIRSIIGRAA